jgi:hypothetical protein
MVRPADVLYDSLIHGAIHTLDTACMLSSSYRHRIPHMYVVLSATSEHLAFGMCDSRVDHLTWEECVNFWWFFYIALGTLKHLVV